MWRKAPFDRESRTAMRGGTLAPKKNRGPVAGSDWEDDREGLHPRRRRRMEAFLLEGFRSLDTMPCELLYTALVALSTRTFDIREKNVACCRRCVVLVDWKACHRVRKRLVCLFFPWSGSGGILEAGEA